MNQRALFAFNRLFLELIECGTRLSEINELQFNQKNSQKHDYRLLQELYLRVWDFKVDHFKELPLIVKDVSKENLRNYEYEVKEPLRGSRRLGEE